MPVVNTHTHVDIETQDHPRSVLSQTLELKALGHRQLISFWLGGVNPLRQVAFDMMQRCPFEKKIEDSTYIHRVVIATY